MSEEDQAEYQYVEYTPAPRRMLHINGSGAGWGLCGEVADGCIEPKPRVPKKPAPAPKRAETVSYVKRVTGSNHLHSTLVLLAHWFVVNREVDLVLLAHPQETRLPGLDKPFLRTSSAVTVTHLCKYLAQVHAFIYDVVVNDIQKLNHPATAFVLSVDTAVLDAEDLTLADVVSLVQ